MLDSSCQVREYGGGVLLKARPYALFYCLGGMYLLFALALRLVLFQVFGSTAGLIIRQLPLILALGAVNDLVALFYLLLPATFLLLLVPRRLQNLPGFLVTARIIMALVIFGLLYLDAVQFFFFQEFNARFNLVAVDYLIYPHEVFVNIWQSYPVGRVLLVMAGLTGVIMALVCTFLKDGRLGVPLCLSQRLKVFVLHLLLLVGAFLGFSTHSLDFSDNRVVNELTANGLSSLFQAFITNHLDYDQYYQTGERQALIERLTGQLSAGRGSFTGAGNDWLTRSFPADPAGLGKLNVVVIVEESLGCDHVGGCGRGLDLKTSLAANSDSLTPFLDKLAGGGVFFNRAYATGTRTVRGLEAISASFPPIPSESIIKRPGNEDIATWGRVMKDNGYQTSFLYGGYGQFDNMNHFFRSNGFAISDRLDIDRPIFTNIWGVSDQDLFRHALRYFDEASVAGRPFFSIIMSTSNHSPYTFPAGIAGIPSEGGGRKAGVRYADYALGEFFRKAAGHSWYGDTLFVVVADHGARVYGREQIPMHSYEIPLLLMAPGRLAARQVNTPISQMDIAPTVLGLLGLPYEAPFFGRDVLAGGKPPGVLLFNHNHDVALYRAQKLVVLGLKKAVNTYEYQLGSEDFKRVPDDPELTELAVSYYQNAFELFRAHAYR